MEHLPILDVGPLVRGEEPAPLARAIARACEEVGFFYAVHHGIPAELERRLEDASRAFFALPDAAKARVSMERGGRAWRGWFPVGGELTSGVPDRKEGLYLGEELGDEDPRVRRGLPLHGRNLFPPELPGLRDAVLGYMAAATAAGQAVLRGVALSLGLPADHFARELTRSPTVLFRVFHYPPPPPGDAGWGVGEHTDYGLLTLLKQDDRGGLEVKAGGSWIAAPPVPGALVCNLGDMLDRMTGGRYRSTPHRVRNASGLDRLSWPLFLDPGFDAEVRPLPGARVRPAAEDAAARWDRASVHDLRGSYGAYLVGKVSRVFPALAAEALPESGR